MSQSPRTKAKQLREPPPSLFLGPPSQNASHVSLPGTSTPIAPTLSSSLNPTTAARAPIIRQRSQRMQNRPTFDGPQDSMALPRAANVLPRQHQESEGKKQADRTDALWAEMQSTLEEVELSAVNGTHVFGPEHNRALEALREAQIGLAQAWARSEADDAVESREEGKSAGAGNTDTVVSGSRSERPGSSGVGADTRNIGTQLEQETEGDILLARQRREANDRYFSRVNSGVLDVVAKLEDVATAMKAVEQESRDIWGENESILGGSAMTSIHGQ